MSSPTAGPVLHPTGDPPLPTQTALIVPVPVAEPVVAEHRRALDPAAASGVPAHVTVLYPFVQPDQVDDRVLAALTAAFSTTCAFECSFARTRWFGDDVLWLDPAPAEPFRSLTAAVWQAFPDHPPYGGAHEVVVPHLTIGGTRDSSAPAVQAAERAVRPRLPVTARIDRAWLVAGTRAPASCQVLHEFVFDPRPAPTCLL